MYYLQRIFWFTKHLVAALHRHVYYHNAYCLFTMWWGEHEGQNALQLACFALWRLKEGMAIFTERVPHLLLSVPPCYAGVWASQPGDVFCTSTSLLPPPPPQSPLTASPLRTRCTGTPTSSLKNQQPLMLDEGKRSWRRESGEKEGGVFPLIDS